MSRFDKIARANAVIQAYCDATNEPARCFIHAPAADVDLSTLGWYTVLRQTGGDTLRSFESFEIDVVTTTQGEPEVSIPAKKHLAEIQARLEYALWEPEWSMFYDYNSDGTLRIITVRARFSF